MEARRPSKYSSTICLFLSGNSFCHNVEDKFRLNMYLLHTKIFIILKSSWELTSCVLGSSRWRWISTLECLKLFRRLQRRYPYIPGSALIGARTLNHILRWNGSKTCLALHSPPPHFVSPCQSCNVIDYLLSNDAGCLFQKLTEPYLLSVKQHILWWRTNQSTECWLWCVLPIQL